MAYDPAIINTAYGIAKKRGANATVILSLFQAGIVESNFTNHMSATNYDSLGYLQQRPSQGWPNPTNVTTATNSYLDRALKYSAAHPGASAGEIAQAVQRSAMPAAYGNATARALALIKGIDPVAAAKAAAANPGQTVGDAAQGNIVGDAVDAAGNAIEGVAGLPSGLVTVLTDIANSYHSIKDTATSSLRISDQIFKFFLPTNMLRFVVIGLGMVFLGSGFYFLSKEMRA